MLGISGAMAPGKANIYLILVDIWANLDGGTGCVWRQRGRGWVSGDARAGWGPGQPRVMVILVQAPRWMRSPGLRGTEPREGTSRPLTVMPFSVPRSTIVQVPSGAGMSLACWRETPGSLGGPMRSISGLMPMEALRRPMRTSAPDRGMRRAGISPGKLIDWLSESFTAWMWS